MKKIDIFIKCIESLLAEVEKEKNNENSLWTNMQLKIVASEAIELLEHAKRGEVIFKYGRRHRMLESTYLMTDAFEKLDSTGIGHIIMALQQIYNKL